MKNTILVAECAVFEIRLHNMLKKNCLNCNNIFNLPSVYALRDNIFGKLGALLP